MKWPTITLGKLAGERLGSVNPLDYPNETFDLYSIPAFDSRVPDRLLGSEIGSSKQVVQPNDVLLSRIVPHIRRAWVVEPSSGHRLIASGEWIVFRSDEFDSDYLRHCLVSDTFHSRFMTTVAGVGGSLLRARTAAVHQIEIPAPSKPEQKRIAAILDKADAIRRKRQEALRLTDDLLRSVFLDMFADSASNSRPMLTVQELLADKNGAIRTGPFGSQLLHSEFVDSGIAVLGIDNAVSNEFKWGKLRFISEDKYDELRRYTVHSGDVIITIMGTVGRCAIVPDDIPVAINTKHLCCITLDHDKCLPEFLQSYFLIHPIARKYLVETAKGAIMDGLNMGLIKALPVPGVPIKLQEEYRKIVTVHRMAKQKLITHQEDSEHLFASLQQQAFSGQH